MNDDAMTYEIGYLRKGPLFLEFSTLALDGRKNGSVSLVNNVLNISLVLKMEITEDIAQ